MYNHSKLKRHITSAFDKAFECILRTYFGNQVREAKEGAKKLRILLDGEIAAEKSHTESVLK